jgi:hypothetical protein
MLAHIPTPQRDQTLESLAALAALRNGVSCKDAQKFFFGTNGHYIEGPFHHGSSHLFTTLEGAGYATCSDFLDKHGLIGLFRPFVSSSVYQEALTKLISNNTHGIPGFLHVLGDSPFVNKQRFCRICAHMEFQSLGYAYAHRAHKIRGIRTCPEHGCILCEGSEIDFQSYEMWGLLLPNLNTQFDNLVVKHEFSENSDERKIGPWVNAVFSGLLLPTEASVRMQLIADKLNAMEKSADLPDSLHSRLDQTIRLTYSEEFLSHLGLGGREGSKAHWAIVFMSRFEAANHAMVNLLALSALFESPSHFNQAAEHRTNSYGSTEHSPKVRIDNGSRQLSLLKDILRTKSLFAVAAKHDISRSSMQSHLNRNPALVKRRKIFQEKLEKKRHQGVLLRAIQENSGLTRSTFQSAHSQSYIWLRLNDRAWFSKQLPPKGSRAIRENEIIAMNAQDDMDERFVVLLSAKASDHLNADVPQRMIKSILVKGLGQNLWGQISPLVFPRTARLLSSLVETAQAYENRVLNRLKELLQLGDHDLIKRWSTALKVQFSDRSDMLARMEELFTKQYAEPDNVPI